MYGSCTVAYRQILDGVVKVTVYVGYDLAFVTTTFLLCFRDGFCAVDIGYVAEIAYKFGIFACAAEVSLTGISVELVGWYISGCLVLVGKKCIGSGYQLIVLLPE